MDFLAVLGHHKAQVYKPAIAREKINSSQGERNIQFALKFYY